MRTIPTWISFLISATTCLAAPVTDWVLIYDGDSDSSFTGGSETTASPSIDDAHKSSMAANIPSVTLADGDSLTLSGTVSFNGTLSSSQFRWGLFDGDNPVTVGQGDEYAGFFADAPGSDAARNIWLNDTSTGLVHPFVTSGTATTVATMSQPGVTPAANTPLTFFLTITRNGANLGISASITDGNTYLSSGSATGIAPNTNSFTFYSVAFLVGGATSPASWNNVDATFSNIDVTHIPAVAPPTVVAFSPADDSTGVSVATQLVATFNEPVMAGSGDITIRNLTDNTTFATIEVNDDSQVTVTDYSMTIQPTLALDAGKSFAIQLAPGAVTDLLGNPHAGIVDPDVSTWNFKTFPPPSLTSIDHIIGQQESGDPGFYEVDSATRTLVGTEGATGERIDANMVLGYTLPVLPAGTTPDAVDFHFEITSARANSGSLPELHVYLLDTANPDTSGADFFYHGASDPNPDAKLVGTTSVTVTGTADNTFPDDSQDRSFTLTGDALTLFRSFYGGDHIPDRSEVFFRFNLSADPANTIYIRYRIDRAADESGIDITPAVSSDAFAQWAAANITAIDAGADATFGGNPDNDSFSNGLEWILGGNPLAFDSMDALLAPEGDATTGLTLTFTREDAPEGVANLFVEFSNDLFNADLPPASIVPAASGTVNGVTYTITENGSAPDTIEANIPASNAPGGKLFGRVGTAQN